MAPARLIQHKKEALWFYSLISIGYDQVFNPGQYTDDMRDVSLVHADLHNRNLKVVDVGGGTGFTTVGIVRYVDPENVTILDQSPDQLKKARRKKALHGVKIMEGDAEDLPFPADTFDRYVSAGRSVDLPFKTLSVAHVLLFSVSHIQSRRRTRIWSNGWSATFQHGPALLRWPAGGFQVDQLRHHYTVPSFFLLSQQNLVIPFFKFVVISLAVGFYRWRSNGK